MAKNGCCMALLLVVMVACIHAVPTKNSVRGSKLQPADIGQEPSVQSGEQTETIGGIGSGYNPPVIFVPGIAASRLHTKWHYNDQDMEDLYKAEGGVFGKTLCNRQSGNIWDKKPKWETQWFNPQIVVPHTPIGACWRYRMIPHFEYNAADSSSSSWADRHGVTISAWREEPITPSGTLHMSQDFGGLSGVRALADIKQGPLRIFEGIISDLKKLGYREYMNMFGAPYDFRKIADKKHLDYYHRALKLLIEEAFDRAGQVRVRLVTHSLGGLVTKRFLDTFLVETMGKDSARVWRNRHIERFIPIAAPFAGASKSVRTAISGEDNGLGLVCLLLKLGKTCSDWFKKVMVSFAGLAWLFPHPNTFAGLPLLEVGKDSDLKTVMGDDVPALLHTLHEAQAPDAANAIHARISPDLFPSAYSPPLVDVFAVNGLALNTEIGYHYDALPSTDVDVQVPESTWHELETYKLHGQNMTGPGKEVIGVELVEADERKGDGTVPYLSSHVPVMWMPRGSRPNSVNGKLYSTCVKQFSGPEYEHAPMLDVKDLRRYVVDVVVAKTTADAENVDPSAHCNLK